MNSRNLSPAVVMKLSSLSTPCFLLTKAPVLLSHTLHPFMKYGNVTRVLFEFYHRDYFHMYTRQWSFNYWTGLCLLTALSTALTFPLSTEPQGPVHIPNLRQQQKPSPQQQPVQYQPPSHYQPTAHYQQPG